MAGAGKKWMTGCGIGCVVVLGVVGLVTLGAFMMLRGTVEGFRQAQDLRRDLTERHGSIGSFTPPGPAALPADRLQVFVGVRRDLADPRQRLEEAFRSFPGNLEDRDESALRRVGRIFEKVREMIRPMGEYVEARNRLLLERGMGQGEYLHYYGLAYYAWLGHAPDEAGRLGENHGDNGDMKVFAGRDASFSPEQARVRYRYFTMSMLGNLEKSLAASGDDAAAATVAAELRQLGQDPERIAWSGSLPAPWRDALRPFRDDLERSYSATANIFEWPRRDDEDGRGLRIEFD